VEYLEEVVGDAGPGASRARKEAFIYGSREMLGFLMEEGVKFKYCYTPDDYSDAKHGSAEGRAVEGVILRRSDMGGWATWMRKSPYEFPVPLYQDDAQAAILAFRTPKHFAKMTKILVRAARAKLRGDELLTLGQSLVGQILIAMQRRGIWIWRHTSMDELLVEDDRVVGALATRNGKPVTIRARHGVLLAAGGFARNREMRAANQAEPIDGGWSSANPGDTGDAIQAGIPLGAATSNLDEAIWLPGPLLQGQPVLAVWERSLPHSIMVDSSGVRYMNESAPYMEAGQAMLKRHRDVPAVPSWLILDSRHRRRYPFVGALPGRTPKEWITSGFMKKADTLEELAQQCRLDPARLRETVDRFNAMAVAGKDTDFGRGDTAYDRYFADETVKPNPSLGTIEQGPFYAVEHVITDVGTVGGLVADEFARVLREDGSVIDGLYASGCSAASPNGKIYPAPGASISSSMTFGYLAARHASDRARAETRAEGLVFADAD
jgi:3-oxosteroid 1-dehydrogenase